MNNLYLFTAVLASAMTLACSRPEGGEIAVSAAVSLTEVLRQAGDEHERATGERVRLNTGATSALAVQVRAGAPCDLFVGADEETADALIRDGFAIAETRRVVAGNRLAVIVPANSAVQLTTAADLASAGLGHIAIADPGAVPAGRYAAAWLRSRGVWDGLSARLVYAENVRAALAAVASGAADAGIVYATDARTDARVRVALAVPPGEAPRILYVAAVTSAARRPGAARAFLERLCGPAGDAAFRAAGFDSVRAR